MNFQELELAGAYLIELDPFEDQRGAFVRTHCRRLFEDAGLKSDFVQSNHSITIGKGTLRGLHLQLAPHQEIKLVQCIRGTVYDVIVDLRAGSNTFLKYLVVELSEDRFTTLYIPQGFAHGFQTLTERAEMIYRHSSYYAPHSEMGLRYDDPKIGIEWPLPVGNISEKDRTYGWLEEGFFGI